MCGLFGAAFIGALAAALIIAILFFLMLFGMLSTSLAISMYKRSITAGFTSFLMLLFGIGLSVTGSIGFLLANLLFHMPVNRPTATLIGFASGALAGILLGKVSVKLIQHAFRNAAQRLKVITR